MNSALEFNNVNKTFRSRKKTVQALHNVSFSLREGEVFGFVGPNGAGKSTTIKVLLDVISDYTGDVTIYGVPARQHEARRGVAYVPESPALYEQFTPMEMLRMALSMHGVQRSDTNAWSLQWLERFSVAHAAERRIRQLSKGTVQRVALAHAMVVSPRLLILDEPLSGLDPVGRKDVIEILTDYKNQGGAIFFTSHVLHDVERIADRFGFINEGQLLTVRSPREIVTGHADRFIIRYQGQSDIIPGGKQSREGEFEVECSQSELPENISRLNSTGGKIISISPGLSLESVFFKILADYSAK